jgi:hypothetical protein
VQLCADHEENSAEYNAPPKPPAELLRNLVRSRINRDWASKKMTPPFNFALFEWNQESIIDTSELEPMNSTPASACDDIFQHCMLDIWIWFEAPKYNTVVLCRKLSFKMMSWSETETLESVRRNLPKLATLMDTLLPLNTEPYDANIMVEPSQLQNLHPLTNSTSELLWIKIKPFLVVEERKPNEQLENRVNEFIVEIRMIPEEEEAILSNLLRKKRTEPDPEE